MEKSDGSVKEKVHMDSQKTEDGIMALKQDIKEERDTGRQEIN